MWLNNLVGLLPLVSLPELVAKLIPPPVAVLSFKAGAFNKIVEISGRNKP